MVPPLLWKTMVWEDPKAEAMVELWGPRARSGFSVAVNSHAGGDII